MESFFLQKRTNEEAEEALKWNKPKLHLTDKSFDSKYGFNATIIPIDYNIQEPAV